jgi:DNA-binding response OmpR family regulator
MKILLIDDNERITKMLSTFLRLNGHECVVTNEGESGMDFIKGQKFDVILLDLAIPQFSGYDIIDALEKNGELKEYKIIVFTASSISKEKLDELVVRGVKDYILKPTDLDELLEKIKIVAEA